MSPSLEVRTHRMTKKKREGGREGGEGGEGERERERERETVAILAQGSAQGRECSKCRPVSRHSTEGRGRKSKRLEGAVLESVAAIRVLRECGCRWAV